MTLYKKEYTVKEWKGFCNTIHPGEKVGNEFQYFNFLTQRKESYEEISTAEILLSKYEIILTDHKTKMEKLDGVLDKFSFENLDKTMTKVSNGIDKFAKAIESKPEKKTRRKRKTEPDYSALFSKKKPKFF